MYLLVVREPGRRPQALHLQGARTSVGRDEHADLVLPSIAVSRRHACVDGSSGRLEVQDLDSRNGLTVNGERVQRQALDHGDVIRIGRYHITFYEAQKLAPAELARIEAMTPPSSRSLDSCGDTLFVPGPAGTTYDDPDVAVVVREGRAGERWQPGSRRLTFGPSGDIPVELASEAGLLAEITWDGRRHRIQRLSLLGKVDINGARVGTATLIPGDRIDVGDGTFRFLVTGG